MALPSRNRPRRRVRRTECILVVFFVCWFLICVDWLRRTAVPKAVPAQVVLEPLCGGTAVGGNGSGEAWPSELPAYPLLPRRRVQVLNGSWEFGFVRGGVARRDDALPSRSTPRRACRRLTRERRSALAAPPSTARIRVTRGRAQARWRVCAHVPRVRRRTRAADGAHRRRLHALLAPCSGELRGVADGARRCRQPLRREGGAAPPATIRLVSIWRAAAASHPERGRRCVP